MKVRFGFTLAVLAMCLLASVAQAGVVGPYAVTFDLSTSVYTLFNNGINNEVAWYMDLNWILDWNEDQTPQMPFTITASPEASLWFAYKGIGFPSWDSFGMDPLPGASVTGFAVDAESPATYFHIVYDNDFGYYFEQEGDVTMVPEPGSLLGLLSGLAGLGAMIRRRR